MTFHPNSNGTTETGLTARDLELRERWSDAARAAALAARRARAAGQSWRRAARAAFQAVAGPDAASGLHLGDPAVGHDSRAGQYDIVGQLRDRAEKLTRFDRVKRARRVRPAAAQIRRSARFAASAPEVPDEPVNFMLGAYGLAGLVPIPAGVRRRPRQPWED